MQESPVSFDFCGKRFTETPMKTIFLKVLPFVLTGMVVLLVVGCSSSSDEIAKTNLAQIMRSGSKPVEAEQQADTYVIRQSDTIQVSVWGYPEFDTSRVPVKESGTVTIPNVGEVVCAGLTKEQFTQRLKQKLSEYIQGEVKLIVTVTSTLVQRVAVLGEVTRQQNLPLTTDASLIEVLSGAGGTTTDADLKHVKILRAGMKRQPIEVDLTWYMENGNLDAIPVVHPGDTVFVPKKENVIRNLSDFMRDAIFILGFFRVLY